jgi:hypothetical protein
MLLENRYSGFNTIWNKITIKTITSWKKGYGAFTEQKEPVVQEEASANQTDFQEESGKPLLLKILLVTFF